MQFVISITDPKKLAGISAARERYNDDLPEQYETVTLKEEVPASKESTGEPAVTERRAITPKPGMLDDAQYVQFVMEKAAESYAKQYEVAG